MSKNCERKLKTAYELWQNLSTVTLRVFRFVGQCNQIVHRELKWNVFLNTEFTETAEKTE